MTSSALDGERTRDWAGRFAESVYATEAELTALDQQAGDGDFGANLAAGVGAAGPLLDRVGASAGPAEYLGALATAFLDEVGGTSGPLFGLLFQAMGRAAGPGPELTTEALGEGAAEGLAAIRRVGDASPGDKTLVDALAPAADALRAAGEKPPADALAAAAEEAWRGCARPRPRRRGWGAPATWANVRPASRTRGPWASPCSSPPPSVRSGRWHPTSAATDRGSGTAVTDRGGCGPS